jgi:dGTPase
MDTSPPPPKHPGHLVLSKARPIVDKRYVTPGKTSSIVDDQEITRSEFERDYDRIIFSKHFRRLSDKTQVVALPDDDHTHTRLIHSLEVSAVGRSIVRTLVSVGVLDPTQREDLSNIVLTACLAHDIGNPPFGHEGERALCEWWRLFSKMFEAADGTKLDIPDFDHFEGNAIGFSILLELGLTYSTILAYSKYPVSAKNIDPRISYRKKNGFLEDDKKYHQEAWKSVGGGNAGAQTRHPLAYIVEAADDICNFVMDIEDCYRHGMMSEIKAKAAMKAFVTNAFDYLDGITDELGSDNTKEIHARLVKLAKDLHDLDPDTRIESIRSFVTHFGILFASLRFALYRPHIYNGTFDYPLIREDFFPDEYKEIFFKDPKILSSLFKGSKAIDFLMDTFVDAALWKHSALITDVPKFFKSCLESRKTQNRAAYMLLSETTRARLEVAFSQPRSFDYWVKETVLAVAFHVFGMTDSHALEMAESMS